MENEQLISNPYIKLMEEIDAWQIEMYKKLEIQNLTLLQPLNEEIPILDQIYHQIPGSLYLNLIKEFIYKMQEMNDSMTSSLKKLYNSAIHSSMEKWIGSLVQFDGQFFENIAARLKIEGWIAQFVAEQAFRPILRRLAELSISSIEASKVRECCKFCGEPIRISVSNEPNQKIVNCPRCETKWKIKKVSCGICGNENHKNLRVIQIRENQDHQIHYCHSCNGYVKHINSKRWSNTSTALMDLYTLHLDYIAQERLVKSEISVH